VHSTERGWRAWMYGSLPKRPLLDASPMTCASPVRSTKRTMLAGTAASSNGTDRSTVGASPAAATWASTLSSSPRWRMRLPRSAPALAIIVVMIRASRSSSTISPEIARVASSTATMSRSPWCVVTVSRIVAPACRDRSSGRLRSIASARARAPQRTHARCASWL
jgi:hypothetical protein